MSTLTATAVCPLARDGHAASAACDEAVDGACHAACRPEPVCEWQGEPEIGAYVWFVTGDWCGLDTCPALSAAEEDC